VGLISADDDREKCVLGQTDDSSDGIDGTSDSVSTLSADLEPVLEDYLVSTLRDAAVLGKEGRSQLRMAIKMRRSCCRAVT
jgi:ABC-type transporter Mla subunit MlaD